MIVLKTDFVHEDTESFCAKGKEKGEKGGLNF